MKFFEKIFSPETENDLRTLHKDFKVTHDKFWYFNREFDPIRDRELNVKAKVMFENPSLLDDCKFFAKIGKNENENVPFPYISFAYGKNKEEELLKIWAEKFPYAELIRGLDNSGVIKKDSEVVQLKTLE